MAASLEFFAHFVVEQLRTIAKSVANLAIEFRLSINVVQYEVGIQAKLAIVMI